MRKPGMLTVFGVCIVCLAIGNVIYLKSIIETDAQSIRIVDNKPLRGNMQLKENLKKKIIKDTKQVLHDVKKGREADNKNPIDDKRMQGNSPVLKQEEMDAKKPVIIDVQSRQEADNKPINDGKVEVKEPILRTETLGANKAVVNDIQGSREAGNKPITDEKFQAKDPVLKADEMEAKKPVVSDVQGSPGADKKPINDGKLQVQEVVKTEEIVANNITVQRHQDGKPINDENVQVENPGSKVEDVESGQESSRRHKDHDHRVAGLDCSNYGGPSREIAAEMVYWRDIPSDAVFKSPFANYGQSPKYLTFEPDEGGWNNIRMSMETATVLAQAMGRILVLPPTQNMYLLWNDKQHKNMFTFRDFFHFDSIEAEHPAVEVISMEEFLKREALTGHIKDRTGKVTFPPDNVTSWNSLEKKARNYWTWLRNVTDAPIWFYDNCVVAFGKTAGPEAAQEVRKFNLELAKMQWSPDEFTDRPVPVDADPIPRLKELLGQRRQLCVYGDEFQNKKVIHMMGDNASGARLLVHFYAYLFFYDWHHDLWMKRFVRDHLRYIDEIQCAAATIVDAVREKAKAHGDPKGIYDSFHIRRGDFQYKDTRVEAEVIYQNSKDVLLENTTIFIATDERNKTFFDPLRRHYNVYFLDDFVHLVPNLNKNYYGMLDQRIASRGRTFVGAFYSTFTGYINRMRGYHSQLDKLPGHEKGEINSYYYIPMRFKNKMRIYHSISLPMWAREFPVGWRDIDHDLPEDVLKASVWDHRKD